ncbi:MAG: hypothetical protein IT323_04435 [Anaerolineae bacterium]|nr:hypothetical protein [Anaerolineae bacterium]
MMGYVTIRRLGRVMLAIVVIAIVGFAPLLPILGGPQPARAQIGAAITVFGLLEALRQAANSIERLMSTATADVQSVLESLDNNIQGLINELETKYRDNLDITISSIDNALNGRLLQVSQIISQVNALIGENVTQIEASALTVLRSASDELQVNVAAIRQSLADSVVVTVQGVTYVLNAAFLNALSILAIVALALGAIVFIVLLFTRGGPNSLGQWLVFGLMVVYLLFFGALLFSSDLRAWVMVRANQGVQAQLVFTRQPELTSISPQRIVLDPNANPSVSLRGLNLLPSATPPAISIGGQAIGAGVGYGDRQINVSLRAYPAPVNGEVTVLLDYGPAFPPLSAALTVMTPTPTLGPPNLAVQSLTFNPSVPIARRQVVATVTIVNRGQLSAGESTVTFNSGAGVGAGTPQATARLAPGQTSVHTFPVTYNQPGSYAITVNVAPAPNERDGSDNVSTATLTVSDVPRVQGELSVGMSGTWPGGGGEPGQTMPFRSAPLTLPPNCQIDNSRGGGSFEVEDINNPAIKYTITHPQGYQFEFIDFTFWRSLYRLEREVSGNQIVGIVWLKGLGGHGLFASRGPERFNGVFRVFTLCEQN